MLLPGIIYIAISLMHAHIIDRWVGEEDDYIRVAIPEAELLLMTLSFMQKGISMYS